MDSEIAVQCAPLRYANMCATGTSGVTLSGNTPTSNVYTAANRISGVDYDAAANPQT